MKNNIFIKYEPFAHILKICTAPFSRGLPIFLSSNWCLTEPYWAFTEGTTFAMGQTFATDPTFVNGFNLGQHVLPLSAGPNIQNLPNTNMRHIPNISRFPNIPNITKYPKHLSECSEILFSNIPTSSE